MRPPADDCHGTEAVRKMRKVQLSRRREKGHGGSTSVGARNELTHYGSPDVPREVRVATMRRSASIKSSLPSPPAATPIAAEPAALIPVVQPPSALPHPEALRPFEAEEEAHRVPSTPYVTSGHVNAALARAHMAAAARESSTPKELVSADDEHHDDHEEEPAGTAAVEVLHV